MNFETGGYGYADADNGRDDPDCGSSDDQCKTITYTRGRIGPTTPGGSDSARISRIYASANT